MVWTCIHPLSHIPTLRLASEFGASCRALIFAIGDVPGLLTRPPTDPEAELIPVWDGEGHEIVGTYSAETDVTGGIFKKVRAAQQARMAIASPDYAAG